MRCIERTAPTGVPLGAAYGDGLARLGDAGGRTFGATLPAGVQWIEDSVQPEGCAGVSGLPSPKTD